MPRVPKPTRHRLAAPPAAVRAIAVDQLDAAQGPDGTVLVGEGTERRTGVGLTITLEPDGGDATEATITPHGGVDIPFFRFFFRPLIHVAHKRAVAHTVATFEAALDGKPPPPPPKQVVGLPVVPFSHDQATLLATASAATAVVGFTTALFGQFNDPISETFNASDARMGNMLAITRVGALLALFATALADRRGRRRSILISIIGSAIACAVSAAAPTLGILTAAQVLQRGMFITAITVAGIAVIEEAPEGARAYSASMLAMAGGFGFSLAVVALPLADLTDWGWRLPFVLGAAAILLAPSIARHLRETTRYTTLAAHTEVVRGSVRDIFTRHRRRFVLLGLAAFLTNVFSAPSSQWMNKYLTDDRGFSNSGVAGFRAVTTAIPGLIGLIVGGRIAETRGRRPVAAIALAIATVTQVAFFTLGGPAIWWMSAISVLASSAGGIALGTLDAELFPTEVRSTSNAMLSIVAVLGSILGFLIAGSLSDPLDGLGRAIAVTGAAAFVAAVFVIPRLPESAARNLDDVSPTRYEGYGPGP
jgi:MFS family permease